MARIFDTRAMHTERNKLYREAAKLHRRLDKIEARINTLTSMLDIANDATDRMLAIQEHAAENIRHEKNIRQVAQNQIATKHGRKVVKCEPPEPAW